MFNNLWKNNDYHVFMALEAKGKLSKDVLYAKGTTRKYWPAHGCVLAMAWIIMLLF